MNMIRDYAGGNCRSLQRYYRSTSRELRRLDALARSPIYTAFRCPPASLPDLPSRLPSALVRHKLPTKLDALLVLTACRLLCSEALSGGPTIRAFGVQQQFMAGAEAAVGALQVKQHATACIWM